jgi:hypothetical protein
MASAISRRNLLQRGLQASVGSLLALVARSTAAAGNVCADVQTMDSGQKSMRTSLNYTETSPDQTKTCSMCSFFQATNEACGTCMIFSGAPANAKGHCDSWSPKG